MSFMETGDWRIVMFIDGTDTEGKATYQHIYQHKNSRKACVGPGFCSDPYLEWHLLQKDRMINSCKKNRQNIQKCINLIFYILLFHH